MKTLRGLLLVLCFFVSIAAQAAKTAQVHLTCLSLRVSPGSDGSGSTLALTSLGFSSPFNGELYPSSSGNYGSLFSMDNFGFPIYGGMEVKIPGFVDENKNGFDDFFEVQQGVSPTSTSGYYETDFTGGTIVAHWSRAPGSSYGTCVFNLIDEIFGNLGSFTHTFQLLEFVGPLTYTPGTDEVTGVIDLVQTDNPAAFIQGPVLFSKVNPNLLVLRPGFWTNDSGLTLELLERQVLRDTTLKTNYYGVVIFADGDPATGGYDYPFWQLSIDDWNDADGDTIPDFSDEPDSGGNIEPPVLSLTRGTTNLWLSISGEVGRLHHVLQCADLNSGAWQTNLTVTLTNNPQLISLPLPDESSRFWRVEVP